MQQQNASCFHHANWVGQHWLEDVYDQRLMGYHHIRFDCKSDVCSL